jgi:stage II sporulation protein B
VENRGNGRTITIKLNGKDREAVHVKDKTAQKERNPVEEMPHIENVNEEPAEGKALSENENIAELEAAPAREAADDEFDWILPEIMEEDPEPKEYTVAQKQEKGTGKKGSIFSSPGKPSNQKALIRSVVVSVFFAVLFGTSLGFLMLKMVIHDGSAEEPEGAEQTTAGSVSGTDQGSSAGNGTLALEPLTVFVVQGGVFSTKDAAEKIQSTIFEKGAPAQMMEMEGKSYLFLGAAGSLEDAKQLGAVYKSKGMDAFAKELAAGGNTLEKLQEEDKKFLQAAPGIYSSMAAGIGAASPGAAIPEEAVKQAADISAQLAGFDKAKLSADRVAVMQKELSEAAELIASYQMNPDEKGYYAIQQHLLSFIAAYTAL